MIKKLLSILGAVIGIIVVLIFAGVGGQVGKEVGRAAFSPSKPTEKEIMTKLAEGFELAAKQINDSAPTMVDEETRMDGARSLLNISGAPYWFSASLSASTQNPLSSVLDKRQLSTFLLAQSMMATRYMNPLAIGM